MARSPRIEFEGADYHVVARGNRRESIVFDRGDRALFWETFGDVCAMTGWEVYAVVLKSDHYHAIFWTPTANLVEGMKWFHNAYTRRIMNQRDTTAGRRRWVASLDGRIRSEQGVGDINGVSFGTGAQRGWYWGSEAFREKLMTRLDSKSLGANPNYRSSAMGQDRRERDGERIIAAAQRHYGDALNELRAKGLRGPAPRVGRVAAGPGNDVAAELDRRATRFEDAQQCESNRRSVLKLPNRSLPKAVREWKTLQIID